MKKVVALLTGLTMAMGLVACGNTSTQTAAPAAEEAPAAEPAPAEEETEAPDEQAEAPAAESTGNEKLVVGFAQIGQESGWRDAETNDVQWYAARNTDTIELAFADAQQKQENQIKAIRNFIEMGVDGQRRYCWRYVFKRMKEMRRGNLGSLRSIMRV